MTEKKQLQNRITEEVSAKEKKQKWMISAAALVLMIVFRVLEPAAETTDVIGMLLAVGVVSLALFRFPMTI